MNPWKIAFICACIINLLIASFGEFIGLSTMQYLFGIGGWIVALIIGYDSM